MRNGLSALHDPDNGRLRLIIAIRSYALVGLLVLLFRLFGLNLVDLDAIPWVSEVEIHCEGICVVDIFTFWLFAEDAVLSAGKRLERPLKLGIVYGLLARLLEEDYITRNSVVSTYQGQKKLVSRDMT